jgi:hypothetical protein
VDDPDFVRLTAGVPHLTIDEIVGHPRMAAARQLYVDRFLAIYGDNPFMARLLIETGRFLVFLVAVVLAAGHDPERRETWFTVGRLKREMAAFGLASERQIDHLIGRLCNVGFMTAEAAEADRRVRILKPTEAMLAHDSAWLAAHYAPLTVASRFADYAPVIREDPAYQLAQRRVAIAFLPFSGKLLASMPDLMLFFNHAAGHVVSASLIQAAMAAHDLRAAVPYADVGERFGVSRTHVRKIVEEAQSAGLVRLHGRGGHRVEILPRFWASYDHGLAVGMFIHDTMHAVTIGRQAGSMRRSAAIAAEL